MGVDADARTPDRRRVPVRGLVLVGLAACLAAGLAARAVGLADRSLWFDEAYTWRMSRHDAPQILDRLRFDNSPPLHYLLVKYWSAAFGDSPVALRSLSVTAGLATIVGVFLFARALLTGPFADPYGVSRREAMWAPLLAAAFVALSPLLVRYGCEVRMYALGAALAAFSAWALVRAADPIRPRWGRWLVFAAVTTLFAYTHAFALLTVAAEAAVVLWWLCERSGGSPGRLVRQPSVCPAATAFGLVAVGFGPWVPTLLDQLAFEETRRWVPHLRGYRDLYAMTYKLFVAPEGWGTAFGPIRAFAVTVVVLAAAAWRGRWVDGVPLTLGLGPILGTIGLCLAGVQVFFFRYLIFSQPFLLVVLALVVARIRPPALFAAAAVTAVTVHGYWCHDLWRAAALPERPGYRGAAEAVARDADPGELIICDSGRTYFPIRYHLRGRPNVYAVYPPDGVLYGGAAADERAEFVPLDQLIGEATRWVWVVNEEEGGRLKHPVRVPGSWQEVSRYKFPEAFGMETVVLVRYQTPARSLPE